MSDSRRSFVRKLGIGSASAAAMFSNFGSGLQKAVSEQPLRSAPSDLKITKVSAAFCTQSQRKMFLKIETNQGITGYGEGIDAVIGGYYLALELGRQITGKNPLDVNRLFDELRRTNKDNVFAGSQAGTTIAILSAIDIALWDLTGKALGLPVYRLLGGKYRDSVHLYTHPLINSGSPENIAASCLEAKNAGYDAVKLWVDFASFDFDPDQLDSFNTNPTNKQIDRIISTVAAVRNAVGPQMGIMVEMHTKFDLPSALKLVKAFEPYNPTWIEEPVPAENMD
jgi:galactonate dehydratase